MTDAEHSVLIYLLDAIKICPTKSSNLINLILKNKNKSESFSLLLDELISSNKNEEMILNKCKEIRERIK